MNPDTRKRLIQGVLLVGLLLVVFGIVSLVHSLRFHLVSSTPNNTGTVSTSFAGFKLEFNHELSPSINYLGKLKDPDQVVTKVEVTGKTMLLLTRSFDQNKHYAFSVRDVASKGGEVISAVNFDFVAQYRLPETLSKKDQAFLNELSARPSTVYPLVARLPYSTIDFALTADFGDGLESGKVQPPTIVAQLYLTVSDVKLDRSGTIEQRKKAVTDWVSSQGFKLSDYTVRYVIIEP